MKFLFNPEHVAIYGKTSFFILKICCLIKYNTLFINPLKR